MPSVIKYKRIFSLPGGTDVSGLTADVNTLKANIYEIVYFESVSAATGTITKPVGSTIQLDQFEGGIDAYVSTIINGQPTGIFPKTAGGVEVDVTSFDALGNYTLSGTPSAYPVAIIYIITIPALYLANALTANRLDLQTIPYGYKAGDTPAIGIDLGISEIVETDANRKLITAAKATGYNLAIGTIAGTIAAGNDSRIVGAVQTSRQLTINGTTYDLSADRSWTITAGSGYWATVLGTPVRVGNTSFTITDTANANLYDLLYSRTTVLKWTDTGVTKLGMIVSAVYAANNITITIIGDTLTAGATMSSFTYSHEKCVPRVFAIAGTIAVGTDLTGRYYTPCAMKVLGADAYHMTAGTTNATTYDVNKNGTTMFTTKVSIASGATVGVGFTANDSTVTALSDYISVDCDSVSTTAPIDLYLELFLFPLNNQYLV